MGPRYYMEVCGQLHALAALSPGKGPPIPTGQVGLSSRLDAVQRRMILLLPGLEILSLCRPARSQSLLRLS
jgi:hypothetical protein